MQRCFLVINKETQVASYLQHRSIIEVTEEHRSLLELNLEKLDIVDVDKFLYIYYQTDDGDLSFRSDMNSLRNLMGSAFFHVSEAMFILVNSQNPLLEDLIHSALRDCPLTRDKIEVIYHTGSLMLQEVGTYLSGNASGQQTASSYRDVYIREADKEEKERFLNQGTGIDAVLPVLTDMSAIYAQRAEVEALSSGRVVSEQFTRPALINDFSRISIDLAKTLKSFVIAGERWTQAERGVEYLIEYFHTTGQRALVVNLDTKLNISTVLGTCAELTTMDIKAPITPDLPTACMNIRFNQLGYVVEYLRNIKGVEQYIFYCAAEDYEATVNLIRQLSEKTYAVYVAHYNEQSVQDFINAKLEATALFLLFGRLYENFNLKSYKKDLQGIVVATFPDEEVDYTEFYELATGGDQSE